jgi:hypothetical protein
MRPRAPIVSPADATRERHSGRIRPHPSESVHLGAKNTRKSRSFSLFAPKWLETRRFRPEKRHFGAMKLKTAKMAPLFAPKWLDSERNVRLLLQRI